MPSLPALRPSTFPPRQAALQRSDRPPSAALLEGGGMGLGKSHREFLAHYNDWQDWARQYARTVGAARFANGIIADSSARCTLMVEERDPATGDWDETEEPRLAGIFDAYRNERQKASELVRSHVWHYQVAGELVLVTSQGRDGADWGIYSRNAIEFSRDVALVKLTPNGNVRDGTAFEVPRDHAVRLWTPDEEYQGYATSPMAAVISDLHRYSALARWLVRTANNRAVMNGAFWTPESAHVNKRGGPEPEAGDGPQVSELDAAYREIVKRSAADDEDLAAVAPFPIHTDGTQPPPRFVAIGRDLDGNLLEHLNAALKSFAIGLNLPALLVTEGGPGGGNHWTDWLLDRKFWAQACAPTMDRVTHDDMTATFLVPFLRLNRLPEDRFRVGYDATPVIVNPDQSEHALKLYTAGLLSAEATLEAGGFDPDQIMGPRDLARLLEVLAKEAAGSSGFGERSGPQNVRQLPPEPPPATAPPLPPELPAGRTAAARNPVGQGAMIYLPVSDPQAIAVDDGEPTEGMHLTLFHLAGDVGELDDEIRQRTVDALNGAAPLLEAPEIDLSHVERFEATEDGEQPVVLVSDTPAVYEMRERLRVALERADVPFADGHAFRAHVTLGYWPTGEGPPAGPVEGEPHRWTPQAVALAWGPDHEPVPLGGAMGGMRAATEPPTVGRAAQPDETASEAARGALRRVVDIRRDLARSLLAAAEQAFADAMAQVGRKVGGRAQSRGPARAKAGVLAALSEGQPVQPWLAAVGLDEDEALRDAFASFEAQARRWSQRDLGRIRAALRGAGLEPDRYAPDDEGRIDEATGFLGSALMALAHGRLTATKPVEPPPGEVTGSVPARLGRGATAILLGEAAPSLGATTADMPTLAATERPRIEEAVAEEGGLPIEWEWVHGFYGEPDLPLDVHVAVDGLTTADRAEPGPDFYNPEPFPLSEVLFPDDHDGDTCEWVPVPAEPVG